ncbi:MAG: aconitate hydratase [Kiritimatiellia bacterium]|jgi:aconitate hydratase
MRAIRSPHIPQTTLECPVTSKTDFGARDSFELADGSQGTIYRVSALEDAGHTTLSELPYSIRVLLEAALRNHDGFLVSDADVLNLAGWKPNGERTEIPFQPSRVILQDFTGVPAVVDVAALRNAMADLGGDPTKVNPQVPVDLVIDHSVQVDFSGRFGDALSRNLEIEYKRNAERYDFLKWGQVNLDNFRAVPPSRGIVHQINLEWIASVAASKTEPDGSVAYFPDSLVGTDSHTTMINGLGVLGWGVGGIEAEAVMLGQPIYMLAPDVVGFKLTGHVKPGVTATDMALRIVEMLRTKGVVGKFVEFYGPGMKSLSLADRATIANMAPEYGATCGFFPVDAVTLDYMRLTGRDDDHIANVERYYRAQGLWHDPTCEPKFTDTLKLDLSDVVPSLAGPKRPQDRVNLSDMKSHFLESLTADLGLHGHGVDPSHLTASVTVDGESYELNHGDVVIAAITSCTNTSNPGVMLAAGLLARNARAKGMITKPWVKTSLAPGSRVVTEYYNKAGLTEDLAAMGYNVVGYGCTTCIGNSGPLAASIEKAIVDGKLIAGSVISGNRNFEGRVHNNVKASYLASPPLVVAYGIAGTLNIDFETDPMGVDTSGNDVFLKDIWPSDEELHDVMASAVNADQFRDRYGSVLAEPRWDGIQVETSNLYAWDPDSTYIQLPTFFTGITPEVKPIESIEGARVLLKLGDSITTDHISPAGAFPADGPAGRYLIAKGVEKRDFNSFGSRRGNHEVMMRGTFANVRIRNELAPGTEGGFTTRYDNDDVVSVFDAAMQYQDEGIPLVVLAGGQYGTGSSRDWAAKGTLLLGVKAVITTSFERIHRSNLVGMGVLPLCFAEGQSHETLGLDGTEAFDIPVTDDVVPLQTLTVTATKADGTQVSFEATVRLDTPVEVDYYRNGGILQTVVRGLAKS